MFALKADAPFEGNKKISGSDYGVTPSAYPSQKKYLYGDAEILINLSQSVGMENWETFFNNIDRGNVVVAFGSSTAVPESTTMLLIGIGLIGLVGMGKKKLFKKNEIVHS